MKKVIQKSTRVLAATFITAGTLFHPVSATTIAESLASSAQTNLLVSKTQVTLIIQVNLAQILNISALSLTDRVQVASIYEKEGWQETADGLTLSKNSGVQGETIVVNGVSTRLGSNGQATISVPANSQVAISTPDIQQIGIVNSFGISGSSGTIKVNGTNQTFVISQTENVNSMLDTMDSGGATTTVSTATEKSGQSMTAATMALTGGDWVACNDYNGPLTDGIHHASGPQRYIDFIGSDCSNVVLPNGKYFSYYTGTCLWDNTKTPYCRDAYGGSWAACSALQGKPRYYHKN